MIQETPRKCSTDANLNCCRIVTAVQRRPPMARRTSLPTGGKKTAGEWRRRGCSSPRTFCLYSQSRCPPSDVRAIASSAWRRRQGDVAMNQTVPTTPRAYADDSKPTPLSSIPRRRSPTTTLRPSSRHRSRRPSSRRTLYRLIYHTTAALASASTHAGGTGSWSRRGRVRASKSFGLVLRRKR